MDNPYIICKGVEFFSKFDEDSFFEWIKKIDCIGGFEGSGDELYLDIACIEIQDNDLRELIALLYRYNIDMKQLQMFLNEKNQKWFACPEKYWHKRVFLQNNKIILNAQ